MKFTASLIVLTSLAGLSVSSAVPSTVKVPSGSGYKNYPLGVMGFKGTIGGHEVALNGTVQEMNAQMAAKFPGFDADALVAAAKVARDAPALLVRNKEPPPLCWPVAGQNWGFCNAGTIGDGIDYLNNFKGVCNVGATSCVRISCSYNAAIFLCNDNGHTITPSCKYMASYAQDIINKCIFWDSQGTGYVCGQEFDTDNYNIIVREDKC